ncbi:Bestrophin, RFP-TM, chloride channel-domain-containing protein [Gaertneriomyces semiglobifer]|nr:Bestrophin, RFP-TM, chloride channel-domain-containing protein [Gaertneriomyces semiglobifer]
MGDEGGGFGGGGGGGGFTSTTTGDMSDHYLQGPMREAATKDAPAKERRSIMASNYPPSSGPGLTIITPQGSESHVEDAASVISRASADRRSSLHVPGTPRSNLTKHTIYRHFHRPSGELKNAEALERRFRAHKIRNEARYSYGDLLRVRASVIPRVLVPALLHTIWGTLWTCLYMLTDFRWFAIGSQLITILGVVISLLLVFRTNTAYDRYWEGRRTWATLVTQIRNLARFVWLGVQTRDDPHQSIERRGAMNLLLAFAVATKHYLRNELGHRYTDLHHLLVHLPDFRPGVAHPDIKNLPLEISFHISSYIAKCRQQELIDISQQTAMTNSLSAMVDCLTSFERIRNTPIPLAYSIHLQQTLTVYILALPFQLVQQVYWGTIPIMFIAAFTLLGIESIGGEIENPFGYDENDLRIEDFCHTTREELQRVMSRPTKLDPSKWTIPVAEPLPFFGARPSETTLTGDEKIIVNVVKDKH